MSGDVQPRKRKDKKRKKDELGIEEPRGTAAVLGEGDVFMHSQNEHGTGGHWCAKIIFFSLLAILITLIGLIILENRGLTELEANAVESRYSGVLQGWLEDSPDDDHHDEHTLDLKHHSDEDLVTGEQDSDVEIEKIEKEYSDEEIDESPTHLPVVTIKKDFNKDEKLSENISEEDEDDEEFLSPEDIEELPIIEPITAPRGKPFIELVEDETSSEKPPNTLAEEEEYEKQQAELNRQKREGSHMWLKVVVGCALLVATHAVVRRATAPRDVLSNEGHDVREETPTLIDRRMTLILEESIPVNPQVIQDTSQKCIPDTTEYIDFTTNDTPVLKQEVEIKEESPAVVEGLTHIEMTKNEEEDKELYSDEDVRGEVFDEKTDIAKQLVTEVKPETTQESDMEEVSDDVEIIDDEQFEEELIDEDEEEISDVDDSELLSRLEAKYGRLPEPERPGPKPKDGGNNVGDEWPGEPSETYWRQYLDQAEQDLQQEWRD